jgi:spore coat protein U-like protein
MKKLLLILVGLSVCMAFSVTTYAATETTTFDVNVTVVPACLVTATGITFPDYDGFNGVTSDGDVTVTCSSGVPYNIALDAGLYYAPGLRRISDGMNFIQYALWQGVSGPAWGDSDYANTYPAGSSLADTGDGTAQAHVVNGTISLGQSAPPGAYSDTVTVTVHY